HPMAVEFNPDVTQLATRVPKTLHRRVVLAALEAGVSIQVWVSDALATHLATVTGQPVTALHQNAPKAAAVPMARRARGATGVGALRSKRSPSAGIRRSGCSGRGRRPPGSRPSGPAKGMP